MSANATSPIAVLKSVIPSLAGVRILDVGCGSGGLARRLVAEGADVTGVDPNPQALIAARTLAPAARFEEASAEALPFQDAAFDVVLFLNALHHVPPDAMDRAVAEAARVARPGGWLIVLEPLAAGNYFDALRVVEDETAVRLAAQNALARAIEGNRLRLETTTSYVRREVFADVSDFFARIVAVDPEREATIQANRQAATAAVLAAAQRDADGRLVLDQPIKADVLRIVGR
ncbi:MAG: class I SAM-dependent methyltransferase [Xanthobacteraceae bacterium]